MKKWFTLCMAVLLLLGVFAGCTKGGSGGETTTAETTTSPLETKSAAITGNTAIRLLESYSKKELGLDNVGKKKYEFMLSTIGSEIKGKKYIRAFSLAYAPQSMNTRCSRSSLNFLITASVKVSQPMLRCEPLAWARTVRTEFMESTP